jgi:GntR family transcriptional regulator/MocR family aminotransferase
MFVKLFAEHLAEWLDPIDGRTGIQIASVFKTPTDDHAIVERAIHAGVNIAPLSLYFAGPPKMDGLLMGYAGVTEVQMRRAFPALRTVVSAELSTPASTLWSG